MNFRTAALFAFAGSITVTLISSIRSQAASAQSVPTVTTGPTPSPLHDSVSWIVPFAGNAFISNGPGEDYHVNVSAEAIDYSPSSVTSFPVLAPADGVVWDYLPDPPPLDQPPDNLGFGNILILYHESTRVLSFYAICKM